MSDEKAILVTGGAGFVGQHLVQKLVNLQKRVVVIDKDPTIHDVFNNDNIKTIHEDITSDAMDLIYSDILPDIEFCFHLAAIASVQESQKNWSATHNVNSVAFVKLLNAIHLHNVNIDVVYASSAAVYGDKDDVISEDETLNPISIYGYDKAFCEKHAEIAHRFFDISSIGLRFFNIFGPGQNPHSDYSGVISKFVENIRNEKPITIYGDGEQVRDFIYIEDVVRALISSMDYLQESPKSCEVMNICTGKGASISMLADSIYAVSNKEKNIIFEEAKEGDIYYSIGDPSRAKNIINFSSEVSLDDGLKALMDSIS